MALLNSVWYSLLALLGLSIRPDAPPTELTPGDVCPWLEVANGYANCDHIGSQTFCNVRCDDKNQGDFTWTKDKGWTPELPSCARQIGGTENDIKEVLKAESGGCPNVNACAKYCRSQGIAMGICIGPGRATCICRRI